MINFIYNFINKFVFILAKLKMMFQTMVDCTTELKLILEEYAVCNTPADIKELVSRFTTDIIGSCVFGINCNSLKDPNSEFLKYGILTFQFERTFKNRLRNILLNTAPRSILYIFGVKRITAEMEKFFVNVVRETVEYREKNNIQRNDFLQLLLQLHHGGGREKNDERITKNENRHTETGQKLTLLELTAQCYVFFVAGFETSATTMTFCLFELALNQNIQNKLRTETETVLKKHDGKLTYEAVMDMEYLDKTVHGNF